MSSISGVGPSSVAPNPLLVRPSAAPKTTSEKVWAVVKGILLTSALTVGVIAGAAALGAVSISLSPGLFALAIGVGAIALLYLLGKGCQWVYTEGREFFLRKKITKAIIDYPTHSKPLQNLYNTGFDSPSVDALIRMHQSYEHLKSELQNNQNNSFKEIGKKVLNHLEAEINKLHTPPSLTIPEYCESQEALLRYVEEAAKKRDLLQQSIQNLKSKQNRPAKISEQNYSDMADKIAKRLETQLELLDKAVDKHLQTNHTHIDPYYSIPSYCYSPVEIIAYVENIFEGIALIDETIKNLDTEINKLQQEPDKNSDLLELGKELLENLNKNKNEKLNQGILVSTKELNNKSYISNILKNYITIRQTLKVLTKEIQKQNPITKEEQRLVKAANKIKDLLEKYPIASNTPVPGYCFYNGNNLLMNMTTIARKQDRIEKAINYIQKTKVIDSKVAQYFQNSLAKLQKGMNVPLPDYFHASRSGVLGIIRAKQIYQSSCGLLGPGAYISTNNEGHCGYGPHTFAIDEGCLVDTTASSFSARKAYSSFNETYSSMWIAVHKHIPIEEHTIAFLDTTAGDEENLKKELKAINLNIEVIDRTTSDGIRKIFDAITTERETPSFNWNGEGKPVNMVLRTV